MAESYVEVPPDSTGKKLRTQKRTVNGNEVHEEVVQLVHAGVLYDARQMRLLTATDVLTVNNLLNPHPVTATALDIRLLTASDIVSAIKSGTWNIDNLLNPHPVKTLHDLCNYKTARFDGNASADIVPLVSGKVIKVHGYILGAQGTVTATMRSGSGGADLSVEHKLSDREGYVGFFAPYPAYHFKTGVGASLYMYLSQSTTVTCTVIYSDADTS